MTKALPKIRSLGNWFAKRFSGGWTPTSTKAPSCEPQKLFVVTYYAVNLPWEVSSHK